MDLDSRIESILFFKNEPMSFAELSKLLGDSKEDIKDAVDRLQDFYKGRGMVVVTDGETVSFGTHSDASELIESLQKDELSRELGRAGLETLAIVLYKGPISRKEIDYIRGVNSGFILRTLLIRGLVERADTDGGRGYSYKPTLKLLEYLGITNIKDLPEFGTLTQKIEEFSKTESDESR